MASDVPKRPFLDSFPALKDAQSAYLGAIDSLAAPDRRTQELVRLAVSTILRDPKAIRRHAMLAAEFGATWQDVEGTLVLTQPGFGFVPALRAIRHAQEGFDLGIGAISSDALDDVDDVDDDLGDEPGDG